MASHSSLFDTLGLHAPQRSQQGSAVLPQPGDRMDDSYPPPSPTREQPQAPVLALWSVGMVLARSCVLTAVAAFLAMWLRRPEQTVRHQLRELCDEAEAKRGDQRQALCVEGCFVPLLAGVLRRWQGT